MNLPETKEQWGDHWEQEDHLRQRINARTVHVDAPPLTSGPSGPYGRTLAAINLYRAIDAYVKPDHTALDLIAELMCLYAAGIIAGRGRGITATPEEDKR